MIYERCGRPSHDAQCLIAELLTFLLVSAKLLMTPKGPVLRQATFLRMAAIGCLMPKRSMPSSTRFYHKEISI